MVSEYVSTFELLLKRQAPDPFPAERVVQGYFLNITNLSETTQNFQVNLVQVAPGADPQNRSLLNNNISIVDTVDQDNEGGTFDPTNNSDIYALSTNNGLINIPSRGTAKLAVLPKIPTSDGEFDLDGKDLEIRGYVQIFAVKKFDFGFGLPPVDVLLTPQNRATFFNDNNQITNQLQSSLPTGDGGTVQKIPTRTRFFRFADLSDVLSSRDDIKAIISSIPKMPEKEKTDLLISLLEAVDTDDRPMS